MRGISDNVRGLILAISSSIFIGSSFIIKKKGLINAGASGTRAGDGGYSYLKEPMWWAGMITMIVGEGANFAAYAYAPAILVTPLGALSIIFSSVLAHFILNERLHIFGVVGCVLCLVGSVIIVMNAPVEKKIESVKQVWYLATEPGFIIYTCVVVVLVAFLISWCSPRYGQKYMVVYIGICSFTGSLTVMCVKAVGIALKLSFSGSNQFSCFQPWLFTLFLIMFCVLQLIYLNKALDIFNTAVVSPVYYVMFTSLTILASMIMFKVMANSVRVFFQCRTYDAEKWIRYRNLISAVGFGTDWGSQNASQITTELCGFITIVCGTFLLHKTRNLGKTSSVELTPIRGSPRDDSSSKHSETRHLST